MGRDSKYSPSLANKICDRLMLGESLRSICSDKDIPDLRSVMRWLEKNHNFRQQYARARELQADYIFDEILEIADTPQMGQKTVSKPDGKEVTTADMIEHRRLRIEARKWLAGKMAPKKYSEKLIADNGPQTTIVIKGGFQQSE